MRSVTKRVGQVELGTIEHEGHSYTALASSVSGRNITGYLRGASLTRWDGSIMLSVSFSRFSEASREYSTNDFGDTLQGVAFKLPSGRWIIGASMGDGMLFRGELLSDFEDESEALRLADQCAEYWAQIDYDDFIADQEQQELERIAEDEAAELEAIERAAGFVS